MGQVRQNKHASLGMHETQGQVAGDRTREVKLLSGFSALSPSRAWCVIPYLLFPTTPFYHPKHALVHPYSCPTWKLVGFASCFTMCQADISSQITNLSVYTVPHSNTLFHSVGLEKKKETKQHMKGLSEVSRLKSRAWHCKKKPESSSLRNFIQA